MVTWVVEQNIFSEECFDKMIKHFKENDISYHCVRVIPFVHEVDGTVPVITGPCVVYGSIGTQKLARKHGWTPGVWCDDSINETALKEKLGVHYLNHDLVKINLKELVNIKDNPEIKNILDNNENIIFIKPDTDTKEFAGTLMDYDEICTWVDNMIKINYIADNDFDVVVSSPKYIGKEWRSIVVNGKVITGSLYKDYGKGYQREGIPDDVKTFIEDVVVSCYNPLDVFVVDIVDTDNGYKVIEYNTFNSAGFYKCDVSIIINEINNFIMKGK